VSPAKMAELIDIPFGCGLGCGKEACIRWQSRSPHVKGQFWGCLSDWKTL